MLWNIELEIRSKNKNVAKPQAARGKEIIAEFVMTSITGCLQDFKRFGRTHCRLPVALALLSTTASGSLKLK